MDVLSQVLRSVKLDGALFVNAEFHSPWAVREPASRVMARYLAPDADHVIIYHLITEGSAWARLPDGPRVSLHAGDIVVFPHGDSHDLGNGPLITPVDVAPNLERLLAGGLALVQNGGAGDRTRIVCGYMACDAQVCSMLLAGLPPILTVHIRNDEAGVWLENSIRFSVEHLGSAGPGAEAMLAKLSEVLFIETLRRYAASLPAEQTGWLAGARDHEVGKALGLIHREPARRWTIRDLATAVGISRSVLAERFSHYLGQSPIAYLTHWRLHLGARMLSGTNDSVAAVATRAGYDSEAAFNRAFKREFGVPPARFRKRGRAGAAAAS